ncbi:MAG TPA: hypothetical protein VD736_09530 [Nitrososphaera sp.]|nr:hypothetical protein [Nitrososphaera sp.]
MVEYKGIEFTEAEFIKLLPDALEEAARKGIMLTVRTIEDQTEIIRVMTRRSNMPQSTACSRKFQSTRQIRPK